MSSTASAVPKWDVFLSFRGLDTRRNFISLLYKELDRRNIQTFKDDKELENGQRVLPELKRAIEGSKFAVVVVSVNYAASPWCLNELVNIMEIQNKKSITVIPIFYGVDPAQLRTGEIAKQFKKHESREEYRESGILEACINQFGQYLRLLFFRKVKFRYLMINIESLLLDLIEMLLKLLFCLYFCLCSEDQSNLIDKIANRISQTLDTTRSNGSNLEGIDKHMEALNLLMELNSNNNVKIVGIWATGCKERSALAKSVYQKIYEQFERHCFLGSVKMISQGRPLSHLKEEFQRKIKGQHSSSLSLKNQKVLLVADDVNTPDQLDALAEEYNNFGPGSVVIVTTHDKQLLISSGIEYAYEVGHLTFQNVG